MSTLILPVLDFLLGLSLPHLYEGIENLWLFGENVEEVVLRLGLLRFLGRQELFHGSASPRKIPQGRRQEPYFIQKL